MLLLMNRVWIIGELLLLQMLVRLLSQQTMAFSPQFQLVLYTENISAMVPH